MAGQERLEEDACKIPEVLTQIRAQLPDLVGEEKLLAEYLLLNYESVPALSLVQLAEEAQVHPSAVIHFCEEIGCEGFHALHSALSQIDSVAASVFFEQVNGFDLEHIARSVFDDIRKMLDQTLEALDMDSMNRAADAILAADQILVLGMGTSGSTAQEFVYRLQWIGVSCKQYVDPHRQLMAVSLLDKDDLVIAVSHSGRTKNVVNCLKVAKERGAKTLCITDFPHSPCTEYADICLCAVHVENSLGIEMVATRAAHLAIVDVIMVTVALRDRSRAIESIRQNERMLVNLRY
jgi:RpiR family transcriptional regulator, carbohydrate utilization regulator